MSGGVPPSSRAKSRAQLSTRADVRKAASLYERFSGHQAEIAGRVKLKPPPKVAVAIGHCDGIMYTTVRDGVTEKYLHKFRRSDAPILMVSPDGSQLLLIGGHYTFTERGIVDMSDTKNLPRSLQKRKRK